MNHKYQCKTLLLAIFFNNTSLINSMNWIQRLFPSPIITKTEPLLLLEPDKLVPVIEQALNDKDFVRAGKLRSLYLIRTTMDRACYDHDDLAAQSAARTLREYLEISTFDPRVAEIRKHIPLDEGVVNFLNLVTQLETKLDELSGPEWLATYGATKCPAATTERASFVIDPAACREKRLAVLRKYKADALK